MFRGCAPGQGRFLREQMEHLIGRHEMWVQVLALPPTRDVTAVNSLSLSGSQSVK